MMHHNDHNPRPGSGPFGMGGQGYLVVAIIILGTAGFAASQSSDWKSVLVSALVPPLIMFPLIFVLSRRWQDGAQGRKRDLRSWENDQDQGGWSGTNLFGYHPGPLTSQGRLIAVLAPLLVTLIILIVAVLTGQAPGHVGPHVP